MKLSASRTFTCKIYYWVTPRLAAGINRWGIPRGVAVHYSTGGRIGSSTFEGKWRRDTLSGVWQRLRVAVDAADRIQGAYLHFLKSVDLDYAYTQIASGGAQLKKRKKYKEAGRFLSLLKGFPTFNAEDKFILAVAQVKRHTHQIVPTARRDDSAMGLLGELYRSSAFPLLEALTGCGKTIFHASTGSHERKICNVFTICLVRPELVEG
ncbi:MAG: hypothetical protein ACE10H_09310 [Candidatus Binatia bacterium]